MDQMTQFDYYPPGNEIFLDDIPVNSLIYDNEDPGKPTPVDISLLWANGYALTEEMYKTLVKILINDVNIAFDLDKVVETESLLESELKINHDDKLESFRLLIALINLNANHDPVKRFNHFLNAKKLFSEIADQVDEMTKDLWDHITRNENIKLNPYLLREKALSLLEMQKYEEAQNLYSQLMITGFDIPGTLCHMARLYLLMHNEVAAKQSVIQAWKQRKKASEYVLSRIIFFRIFFSLIDNKCPDRWILRFVEILNKNNAFMEWSINTMLEEYRSRFSLVQYEIIYLLAGSMQNKGSFDKMMKTGFLIKFTNPNPESK